MLFGAPEMVAQTYRPIHSLESDDMDRLRSGRVDPEAGLVELRAMDGERREMETRAVAERSVAECLRRLDPMFRLEQTRVVGQLVDRMVVNLEGLDIQIRAKGLHSLVTELTDTRAA